MTLYNIYTLSEGFHLRAWGLPENELTINENSSFTNIEYGDLDILYEKQYQIGRKRIQYKTPVVDNSSISVELYADEENRIDGCYIDFRTHKGNGKVNGTYELRIRPQMDFCTLNFVSRKGWKTWDFSRVLVEENEELFYTMYYGKLTMDMVDEVVKSAIPIINRMATRNGRQTIAQENEDIISNAIKLESDIVDFVKQVKEETQPSLLQENLEKFLDKYDKNKNNDKKRILKK